MLISTPLNDGKNRRSIPLLWVIGRFFYRFSLQCRRHADISTVANITRKAKIRDKKRVKTDTVTKKEETS